jgi:2-polyprenyl-6-methoxyphenol hydroxylase-like FAD-dependent oxidoreductase
MADLGADRGASLSDVIIVGAGPVGTWLAGELRLAGASVTILERTPERGLYTRGMGVHARTLEVLAMRGMAEVPVGQGRKVPKFHYGMLPGLVDFSVLDTQFPFVLAYPQQMLEDWFERRAVDLGATVLRGHAVTDVTQDQSSVRVRADTPDGPRTFAARYAVGCDGARSTVREAAGIDFPGTDSTLFGYVGDVTLGDPPEHGTAAIAGHGGSLIVAPLPGSGRFRLGGFDPNDQEPGATLTPERLRASVIRAAGRDFGLRDPASLSRFGNATRQAASYQAGRVLLAGDAAHMHLPTGGVGLNVGVQDAMNLGWKLGAVVQGRAPEELLGSYHAERHPVGAELLRSTLAQTALITAFSAEGLALRQVLADLITSTPELSRKLAETQSGLSVAYLAGPGAHPLTGRRVPDLAAEDGTVFGHLAGGSALLLNFAGAGRLPSASEFAAGRGILVRSGGRWPGQDKVAAALIRPDGYVAWAGDEGDGSDADAVAALTSFGVRFALSPGRERQVVAMAGHRTATTCSGIRLSSSPR